MTLSEVKNILATVESVSFQLPNGTWVPEHFHVTEVGVVSKHFIDFGGTVRQEKVANFQLWDANDFEHRLKPQKLRNIIALSERALGMEDLEIEVEYQSETFGKYGLGFNRTHFELFSKHTDCLAKAHCGVLQTEMPAKKVASCTNGSGCC